MEVERFDLWLHKGQIKYNNIADKETRQKKAGEGGRGERRQDRQTQISVHMATIQWGRERGVQS